MTTELWILVATAGLQWVLIMTAATPRLIGNGMPWALGNRHTPAVELPQWADRAQRASDNMAENLPLFAIVVLVVHVIDGSSDTTTLGAWLFLAGRVAHAAIFMAGIPVARTLSWAVSIVGLFLVASGLL